MRDSDDSDINEDHELQKLLTEGIQNKKKSY
jgi:hypothetical protein